MAFIFGVIGNSFLCRRNFLYKQIIRICEYATGDLNIFNEHLSGKRKEFMEVISPLLNANDLSQDLCSRVRNEMINKRLIPEEAIDTRVFDLCVKLQKPEIAKVYFNYLESNGYSINPYALARYLRLYNTEKSLTNFEENEIINIVERLQREWEHIPVIILKDCVAALCKTCKWRKSLQLIKREYNSNEIKNIIISHIIPVTFQNGEIDLGLKFLNETDDPQNSLHRHFGIYESYLNYYLQNKPAELNAAIEKIFLYWENQDLVPTNTIADHFVNVCKNAGWITKYVTMKQDGYCSHCGNYLSALSTKDESFKKLARNIVSDALIDTDIFQYTTPFELKKFKNFIYRTKPYDIIIDGLNTSQGGVNNKWLKDIIDYFIKSNKKILIIARQHMYPQTKWIFLLKNVYIYYFENTTADDPYILYATLMSGNNAKFVSFDLLRQHVHKLKSKQLQRQFKRWQYTHQYTWFYDSSTRKAILKEPWLCDPFTQYNNGFWHVPYRTATDNMKLLYKPSETWICFRSPQK